MGQDTTIQPKSGAEAQAPPPWGFPMPGRDGVRAPIPRFPDLQGHWGYVLSEASQGIAHYYNLFDFIRWPEMGQKKVADAPPISDLTTLVERNFEDNLEDAGEFKCWSQLWGKHEGETLVVASTGPSLTASLPAIYKHRDRFRLLTINRGLRAFTDPRFRPDYYHFVERRGRADWVHEIDETGRTGAKFDLSGITLIGTPQCDPRVVRCLGPGEVFWGYTSLGPLGHHKEVFALERVDVQATSTLANTTLIAYKLGFAKVIYVGCDFAIESQVQQRPTEDGGAVWAHLPARVYFDQPYGALNGAMPPWAQKPQAIMGHDEKAVLTTASLHGMGQFFVACCDFLQYSGGVEVINATPRGLVRWNNQTLEEALGCA